MAWIIPENKLDAQQRDFLDNVDVSRRNVWIKGFAGSGKSVLLVYTAMKIFRSSPSAKVLLIAFTRSLVEMYKAAFAETAMGAEGPCLSVKTYYAFMDDTAHYDYILCDEVQDLPTSVFSEMNNRAAHVVVAGDTNQSIYDRDPRWGEATVDVSDIEHLINGTSFALNVIHRLSKSIINAVQRLIPLMSIFSAKRDMTKSDTQIRLCEASSREQEARYVMEQAAKAVQRGYTAAVLIPSSQEIVSFANMALANDGKPRWEEVKNRYGRPDFGLMNKHLADNGVLLQYVGGSYGGFSEDSRRVVLMTFHSAKGLDFDNVFIPYAGPDMSICPDDDKARTLLMVAMTRARQDLYFTYTGSPSPYLGAFEADCSHINISGGAGRQPGASIWGF